MKTETNVSTTFSLAASRHRVHALVTIGAEAKTVRPPINVSLVLDRSGSMAGIPLIEAKAAAAKFLSYLAPSDTVSVVAFDDQVETVYRPGPVTPEIADLVEAICWRGSTNLSGGWLKGREYVAAGKVEGTNRVVLLTDGQANQGITDPDQIVGMIGGATREDVSTTCIGFGPGFEEDLLQAAATAGQGNFWYVETADQMSLVFDEEIEGLVSLVGQNVEVTIELLHPDIDGVTFPQGYPAERTESGDYRITLGDLVSTRDLMLGMEFHADEVSQLGTADIARVTITADLLGEGAIEHRSVVMPISANLDEQNHEVPEVERTFTRYEVARARQEATRRADSGDYEGASTSLREASLSLEYWSHEPAMAEEMEDLSTEAERMARREYSAADRKYHAARGLSLSDNKDSYREKIRRTRRDDQ